ncbi:MAG: glycosyltransferase family 39 protein [Pseudomonadota bacterium]
MPDSPGDHAQAGPSYGLVLALLILLALAFQGSRPLYEPDEGRYTDVALQMLDSGNWWLPKLHPEQTHFTKPPLTYWSIAVSLRVFGRNAWAARLPHALAFIGTGLLVFGIARTLQQPAPGIAAAMWATSLAPFVASNLATTDTLLVLFETAAMAAFLRALTGTTPRTQQRSLVLMWLAFGLAFLTKGPPGLLPLLVILTWTVWQQPSLLRRLFVPWGLLLFAITGLGWYAGVIIGNAGLLDYFLRYEFVDRIFTDVHARNPAWHAIITVYGATLLLGTLPWLPLTLLARRAHRPHPPVRAMTRLLWLWLLLPLGVFCLAQSRLPLYVLPLFVPISLLGAPALAGLLMRRSRLAIAGTGVWVAGLIMLKAAGSFISPPQDALALSHEIRPLFARMITPPDEIAFLGTRPAYGLRFYLGLPIEDVALRDSNAGGATHTRPGVCTETLEGDHPLWLLPARLVAEFTAVSAACGYRARDLEQPIRDWESFELIAIPRSPPAAAGPR